MCSVCALALCTCAYALSLYIPSIFYACDELELIQSHMAQKPVLWGEVGCACVAREGRAPLSPTS